jgi:hypothetical protein
MGAGACAAQQCLLSNTTWPTFGAQRLHVNVYTLAHLFNHALSMVLPAL